MAITSRTVNRLITAVLCDILGIYNRQYSIPAADAQAVKETLQDILGAWSIGTNIPIITTENFAMVSAQSTYTVGENGTPTKNTLRPEEIVDAWVRIGDTDYPVAIYAQAQWRDIGDKSTAGRPTVCFPQYTTPNVTLELWPVPDSTDSFYFCSRKPFIDPTSLTDTFFVDLQIPPQVYQALKWQIAIDLAGGYGKPITQEMAVNARRAYADALSWHTARQVSPTKVDVVSGRKRMSFQDFKAGY